MRLIARTAAVFVVAATLAAGCALRNETAGGNRIDDCVGVTCPTANIAALGIEIFAAGIGAQEFRSLPYDTTTRTFQIETAPSVKLSGRLSLAPELAGLSLGNATIVATRPSRLSGRPDVSYQGSVTKQGEYSLDLPPNIEGEQYTLRMSLDNKVVPPIVTRVTISRDTVLDLVPPAPSTAATTEGTVLSALGVPMPSVEVSGRDPLTNQLVTTIGTTDAAGKFLLVQGAQTGSGGLRLEARINETLHLERVISLATPTGTNKPEPIVLQLPALLNPVATSFRCVGISSAGTETPVSGAQITARVDIIESGIEVTAVHEVKGTTDADGNVSLPLYRGESTSRRYGVTILTPGTSPFRTTTTEIEASQTPGGYAAINLEARPQVFGTIIDAKGAPVGGATVEPRQSSLITLTAAESLAALLQPSTTTDSDGKFIMYLDPGTYDFEIAPRFGSGLPRFWKTTETVEKATDLGLITAPKPARLVGRLVDSSQAAKPNVTVRIFELPSENAACLAGDDTCGKPARLQAELTSRADGTIEAILPAQPTAP